MLFAFERGVSVIERGVSVIERGVRLIERGVSVIDRGVFASICLNYQHLLGSPKHSKPC